MNKLIITGLLACSASLVFAGITIPVEENKEITMSLSSNNYNRIVIKGDEIVKFYYPKGTMIAKQDESDSGFYLQPQSTTPFNLFVATDSGKHYALIIKSEESLGKMIELIPGRTKIAKKNPSPKKESLDETKQLLVELVTHMERKEPLKGFKISRHYFGQAERLNGMRVLPKESWKGGGLKGEVLEAYNNSKREISLTSKMFATADTRAVKLSSGVLSPKQHITIYRVLGGMNG